MVERFAIDKVFGLEGFSVGGDDELRFRAGSLRAGPQRGQSGVHLAFGTDREMDVVALQDATGQVGSVRIPTPEPLESGLLVPEGLEEGVRKALRVERLLREPGNGFFDFDGVHIKIRKKPP